MGWHHPKEVRRTFARAAEERTSDLGRSRSGRPLVGPPTAAERQAWDAPSLRQFRRWGIQARFRKDCEAGQLRPASPPAACRIAAARWREQNFHGRERQPNCPDPDGRWLVGSGQQGEEDYYVLLAGIDTGSRIVWLFGADGFHGGTLSVPPDSIPEESDT